MSEKIYNRSLNFLIKSNINSLNIINIETLQDKQLLANEINTDYTLSRLIRQRESSHNTPSNIQKRKSRGNIFNQDKKIIGKHIDLEG